MNKSISVFKFGVIKSGETLSRLSIDFCIVTCGRQVGICIVTRLEMFISEIQNICRSFNQVLTPDGLPVTIFQLLTTTILSHLG